MSIKIRELDHVVIRVKDVKRAMQFYCEVLGCHEERRLQELGLIQLRAGSSMIDLVDIDAPLGQAGGNPPGKEGRNMDHFCVRIEPFDESAIQAHLQQYGIQAGDAEMRYGAEGTGPSIYLEDPDGNVIELKGPPMSM